MKKSRWPQVEKKYNIEDGEKFLTAFLSPRAAETTQMTTVANDTTKVQEYATKLREEIQQWLELAHQLEERANRTNDASSLGVMEGFLRSARQTIERVIEPETAQPSKEYPFMPVAEPQEVTLPANLRPPGKGVPVKSRKGSIRLPDPAFFPKE